MWLWLMFFNIYKLHSCIVMPLPCRTTLNPNCLKQGDMHSKLFECPKNYIGAFQQYVSTKSTIQYNFFCVKQAVRDLEMLYDDMVPWELPGVLSITARFKTLSL